MNIREAAKLAIEALQDARSVFNGEGDTIGGCGWCHAPSYGPCEPHCEKDRAVKALRAALAENAMQRLTDVQQEMGGDKLPPPYDHLRDATKMMATINETETVEPVAWMVYTLDGQSAFVTDNPADFTPEHRALTLYTAPPKRKPLTEEQIEFRFGKKPTRYMLFLIRSTERAHGIGVDE